MLTLRQVRYFMAVADNGQISAAAAELGISQSAITLSIQDLEAELGVTLFERKAGGVNLTNEGQKFLSHARNIESATTDAVGAMRSDRPDVPGRIRLGVTYASAGYYLFPVLARFRRSHPNIEFDLTEASRDEIETMLEDEKIDLALLLVSNLFESDSLKHRALLRSRRGLWLSSAHPLSRRKTVSLADVESEPYVMFLADMTRETTMEYWRDAGYGPNVVFETNSLEAVRGMVATGAAVTILSDLVHRPWSLDGGRVEVRRIEEPVPSLDIGIAWRRAHEFSEAERRFRDYLESRAR